MKKSKILFLLLLGIITTSITVAQKTNDNNKTVEVEYTRFRNGKKLPGKNRILSYRNNIAYLSNSNDKENLFIDFKNKQSVKILTVKADKYKLLKPFSSFEKPKYKSETETILGYECKRAVYKVFSNDVEVWYTDKAPAKGSPSISHFPDNSLVLKYVVNGNYTITAVSINKSSKKFSYLINEAKELSEPEYKRKVFDLRYTTVKVFDNEQINFGDSIINKEKEIFNHTYRFSKGTVILKKIKLPEMKPGGYVFMKLINRSNGDAYDRIGSVFTFSDKKAKSMLNAFKNGLDELPVYKSKNGKSYQGISCNENYSPPIELMRFFTSFGVSFFNNKRVISGYDWSDSVVYKQDITELISYKKQEMWIGVYISNYDKGGHKISMELNVYPPFEKIEPYNEWIFPIFNTVNVMEMSGQNYGSVFLGDALIVEFNLPENVEDLKLRYTSTGHGGWGNGDEYNQKLNRILIDGKEVFSHIPWRTDCATYRLSNPSSGNFGNGLSSSDLSRSNWCPATLTPPFFIPLKGLKPGKHTLKVAIPQGENEGNSFSFWSVSGTLIGKIKKTK